MNALESVLFDQMMKMCEYKIFAKIENFMGKHMTQTVTAY